MMENINIKMLAKNRSFISKRMVLHFFIAFILGRATVLDCISPFGMAYLCTCLNPKGKAIANPAITALFSVAGAITLKNGTGLKYLLAYVLFGIICMSVNAVFQKKSSMITYLCGAGAMAISGIIFYARQDRLLYRLGMLAVECGGVIAVALVIGTCCSIILGKVDIADIKKEDVLGLYLLVVLLVAGFCGIYIGDLSLSRVFGGIIIMITSYTGGCPFATTVGVAVGVLNSLYAFEFNEYPGVFGFCGMVTGLLSKFRRPGIILGFILSSKVLSVYYGGWSDSVFNDFEIISAICIFCLVPNSALFKIKGILNPEDYRREELQRTVDYVEDKIHKITKSMSNMAEFSSGVFARIPENTADISTFYEKTADVICKTCGLRFVCWDKEVYDTRDALNKMTDVLREENYIDNEDIPDIFKKKCIKYGTFVNELNKRYCAYKMDNMWRSKAQQGNRLISMQLDSMKEMAEGIGEVSAADVYFDKAKESAIFCKLEEEGYKCIDVTVARATGEMQSVTVTVKHKSRDNSDLFKKVERVCSEVLKKNMSTLNYSCQGSRYVFNLEEKPRFKAECSYISTPKEGERQCGDSIIHGLLSQGKYGVVLSDGMGSGPEAARISSSTAELIYRFLGAGFDRKRAVAMAGSAIMMNYGESFATVDALLIDLFTGSAEFIKAGANATYLKSSGCVRKYCSDTLPVGMIENTETDIYRYGVRDGDILIMISDGIHNAADNWFEDYVLNMHEQSPKMIAQLLYDEAKRNKSQDDDMTVAVIKITKA